MELDITAQRIYWPRLRMMSAWRTTQDNPGWYQANKQALETAGHTLTPLWVNMPGLTPAHFALYPFGTIPTPDFITTQAILYWRTDSTDAHVYLADIILPLNPWQFTLAGTYSWDAFWDTVPPAVGFGSPQRWFFDYGYALISAVIAEFWQIKTAQNLLICYGVAHRGRA